jgi:hypothetical protein
MSLAKRLMREYEKSGKVGRVKPDHLAHAKEIIGAIVQRVAEDDLLKKVKPKRKR